jgi:hypothetical protein
MEENDLYPPLESLSADLTHFEINLGDDYRVRVEKDDLYPPQESLSKDFSRF